MKALVHPGAQWTPDRSSHLSRGRAEMSYTCTFLFTHTHMCLICRPQLSLCLLGSSTTMKEVSDLCTTGSSTQTQKDTNQLPVILGCRNSRKRCAACYSPVLIHSEYALLGIPLYKTQSVDYSSQISCTFIS